MQILLETLDKKIEVLKQILTESKLQEEVVLNADIDWDEFDAGVERKGNLIDELSRLDDGFEAVFAQKKEQLLANQSTYRTIISMMQDKIREITDLSTELEKQEYSNKTLVEKAFSDARIKVRTGKRSSKVAMDYYKRMNQVNYIDPQLMDKKS